MHLYETEIVTYFFREILKFGTGQCHTNQSSQHFQAHFFAPGKSY